MHGKFRVLENIVNGSDEILDGVLFDMEKQVRDVFKPRFGIFVCLVVRTLDFEVVHLEGVKILCFLRVTLALFTACGNAHSTVDGFEQESHFGVKLFS